MEIKKEEVYIIMTTTRLSITAVGRMIKNTVLEHFPAVNSFTKVNGNTIRNLVTAIL